MRIILICRVQSETCLLAGDVPRVDGQLAVARAFGDWSLKKHLSSEPYVVDETITENSDFLILASDGLWKVMNMNLTQIVPTGFMGLTCNMVYSANSPCNVVCLCIHHERYNLILDATYVDLVSATLVVKLSH